MHAKRQLLIVLENILNRFPKSFDTRLFDGCERLAINTPKNFIANRPSSHLLLLLVAQFFLQNKMELAIEKGKHPYPLFAKVFRKNTHLCLMTILPISEDEYAMGKGCFLKVIQQLVPLAHEIEGSYFRWLHPEFPYMCLYLEVQKLRGPGFSSKEARSLESALREQLAYNIPNLYASSFLAI